jgi:hypothetical protein
MLIGYFDESGTHDDAVITSVAGFISTADNWQAFNEEWKRVLDHWELEYFHMKECAHCVGDFVQFKKNEVGRRQLLWCLAFIICRHCLYSCAVSVVRKDQKILNADPRIGSAYNLAAKGCLALADRWMESTNSDSPLSIVLEDGCKDSRDFLFQLKEFDRPLGAFKGLGSVELGSKKTLPALQAADFLAYEQSKYFTDCLRAEKKLPLRKTLELLQVATRHNWELLHLESIADLLMSMVMNDVLAMDRETILRLDPDAVLDDDYQPSGVAVMPFPPKR